MNVTPLPGACHPAYADVADQIRMKGATDSVRIPFLANPVVSWDPDPDPMGPSLNVHTLTRQRASQSFYPEYGAYVWDVWTDELGRSVAAEGVEWIPNPMAFIQPEWNPVKRKTRAIEIAEP